MPKKNQTNLPPQQIIRCNCGHLETYYEVRYFLCLPRNKKQPVSLFGSMASDIDGKEFILCCPACFSSRRWVIELISEIVRLLELAEGNWWESLVSKAKELAELYTNERKLFYKNFTNI